MCFVLAFSVVSCKNGEKNIILDEETTNGEISNKDYVIYNYSGGEGDNYSSSTHDGYELFGSKQFVKEGIDNKKMVFFNEDCDLYYMITVDLGIYDERFDDYSSRQCFVMVGENTGKIISYGLRNPDKTQNNDASKVNVYSTRQEFIDYASEILLNYTGVSTEGCDVEVQTSKIKTTYKYSKEEVIEEDFINFSNYDPSFSAEYQITFYKKLSDIHRIDDISVTLRSDGTILSFKNRSCDEKFKKFNAIKIDKKLIETMVVDKFESEISNNNLLLSNIELFAVPDGDNLWVLAKVFYKHVSNGETFSSVVQYLVKVV